MPINIELHRALIQVTQLKNMGTQAFVSTALLQRQGMLIHQAPSEAAMDST